MLRLANELRRESYEPDVDLMVRPIVGHAQAMLGIDEEGRPVLLLDLGGSEEVDLVLEEIAVRHSQQVRLSFEGSVAERCLTTIACLTSDRSLQRTFLSLADVVLEMIEGESDGQAVVDAIERLVRLLATASAPAVREEQGLFAELVVLLAASEPLIAVEAWRVRGDDRHDMAHGNARIEVKSSGRGRREHELSLDQCRAPDGVQIILASVLVEQSGAGLTVVDLANELTEAVRGRPDLVLKVQEALMQTTNGSTDGLSRFDRDHAVTSLRLYQIANVPSIADAPIGVRSVRFTTDLAFATSSSATEIRDWCADMGPLVQA